MTGGEFIGFTNVDHDRPLAVDQLHRALDRQRATAGALQNRPEQQPARGQCNRHQHPVIENKFHFFLLEHGNFDNLHVCRHSAAMRAF